MITRTLALLLALAGTATARSATLHLKPSTKMLQQPSKSPVIESAKSDPARPQSDKVLLPETNVVLFPSARAALPLARITTATRPAFLALLDVVPCVLIFIDFCPF